MNQILQKKENRLFRKKIDPYEIKREKTEKKGEIIRNFVIPTTKEDLLEFFTYIMSKIEQKDDDLDEQLVKVWKTKLDEVYAKLLIVLDSDSEQTVLQNIKQMYEYKHNIKSNSGPDKYQSIMLAIVLPLVTLFIMGGFVLIAVVTR